MRVLLFIGLLVAATAFLLGACAGEEEVSPGTAPSPQSSPNAPGTAPSSQSSPAAPAGGPVTFETIGVGDQSGMGGGQPQLLKLDTQAKWTRRRASVLRRVTVPAASSFIGTNEPGKGRRPPWPSRRGAQDPGRSENRPTPGAYHFKAWIDSMYIFPPSFTHSLPPFSESTPPASEDPSADEPAHPSFHLWSLPSIG